MTTSTTDRLGNAIGGTHEIYDVVDFKNNGYDFIETSVSKSDTTESVYVYYKNTRNENIACVRFSRHSCNAVRFGDVLQWSDVDEILYRLGLKGKRFVPDTRLFIASRQVKKIDIDKYDEAPITIQDMYALGAGASLIEYKGKLAKGSNFLILGDSVVSYEDTMGHYEYFDL